MIKKILIVSLGILLISHLSFYCKVKKNSIKAVDARRNAYENQIRRLNFQKLQANRAYKQIQTTVKSLLPWLNTGFDDSERGLVKFLDFLNPELLQKTNAKITFTGVPVFQKVPVALQKSSFQVGFEFVKTADAEAFLEAFLLQRVYPLKVNSADIQRGKDGKTTGKITMDLLLPASLLEMDLNAIKELGI